MLDQLSPLVADQIVESIIRQVVLFVLSREDVTADSSCKRMRLFRRILQNLLICSGTGKLETFEHIDLRIVLIL